MCRSIKVLRKPGETASDEEMRGAALQFVRKITGFHKPSRANQEVFNRAVLEISDSSERLLKAIGASRPNAHEASKQPEISQPETS